MTPLTSMVVTLPDVEEAVSSHVAIEDILEEAAVRIPLHRPAMYPSAVSRGVLASKYGHLVYHCMTIFYPCWRAPLIGYDD